MRTPEDGDKASTGLGHKVPPKIPEDDDELRWKPIEGHRGYQRHEITGEVRETPPPPQPPMSIYEFFGMKRPGV